MGRRSVSLLFAALCLGLAACALAPTESGTQSGATSAPNGSTPSASAPLLHTLADVDLYYPAAGDVAQAAPGEIINSVEIQAPAGMRAWTVIYGSTGLNGEPVPVSGLVLAPTDPPSGGGYPVFAWAHGTTGIADLCAPSRSGAAGGPTDLV